jgi:hypothetical protein
VTPISEAIRPHHYSKGYSREMTDQHAQDDRPPDTDKGPKFTVLQKMAAGLATATTVVVALTYFFDKLPDLFAKSQKAYVAIHGMYTPRGMQLPNSSPPSQSGGSALDNQTPPLPDLGPPPGPNCHEIMSADYSVFPPKYNRSWGC